MSSTKTLIVAKWLLILFYFSIYLLFFMLGIQMISTSYEPKSEPNRDVYWWLTLAVVIGFAVLCLSIVSSLLQESQWVGSQVLWITIVTCVPLSTSALWLARHQFLEWPLVLAFHLLLAVTIFISLAYQIETKHRAANRMIQLLTAEREDVPILVVGHRRYVNLD